MKLCNDFSLTKDRFQWILEEFFDSKDKNGNQKRGSRKSFHANLNQVSGKMLNSCSCNNLDEYIARAEDIQSQMQDLMEKAYE